MQLSQLHLDLTSDHFSSSVCGVMYLLTLPSFLAFEISEFELDCLNPTFYFKAIVPNTKIFYMYIRPPRFN